MILDNSLMFILILKIGFYLGGKKKKHKPVPQKENTKMLAGGSWEKWDLEWRFLLLLTVFLVANSCHFGGEENVEQ